jgi:hypothetical protein
VASARPRAATSRRLGAAAFSVAAHVVLLVGLFGARHSVTPPMELDPIVVQLVQPLPPPPPPPPEVTPPSETPTEATPEPPPPRRRMTARPPKAPTDVKPLPADPGPPDVGTIEVSEAAAAGAATAESGTGSGECNMARRLQTALRRDRLVQSAVANAHRGRPILVWNGDWVRHGVQDGAGLAAVREAILWEVGFAPAACRAERVQGLVLISLNDRPGAARIVVGGGHWRWSDLLATRGRGRG